MRAARFGPRASLGVGLALLLGVGTSMTASGALVAGAPAPALVPIGAAPQMPEGSHEVSTLAATDTVRFSVVLASQDPAGLAAEAAAVSTPGTPQYRDFLSSSQATAAYGPDPGDAAAVTSWLQQQGLTASDAIGDGLVIPVSGSASAVESAFGTSFENVTLTNGTPAYANTVAPEVPGDLAGDITGIIGLNTLGHFDTNNASVPATPQEHPSEVTAAHAQPAGGPTSQAAPAPCSLLTEFDGAGGADAHELETLYDAGPLYSAGLTGSGITVGLIEGDGSFSSTDISVFENCYGTSDPVTAVAVDGGCSSCSVGGETMLDIDTVIGFAPGVSIQDYEAPDDSYNSLFDDLAMVVSLDEAQVVSESYGGCEPDVDEFNSSYASNENTEFEMMTTQGQTMFASSGDQGSEGCIYDTGSTGVTDAYASQLAVNDPASQPYVTAVGGTSVLNINNASTQTVWNGGPFSTWSGNAVGSGGISEQWTMPSFQTNLGVVANSSGAPCDVSVGHYCREVPDVAASADDEHHGYLTIDNCQASNPNEPYYYMFDGMYCEVFQQGGTSFSSPLWASMTAIADQEYDATNHTSKGLGSLNSTLYSIADNHPSAFTDITTGNDDYLSSTNDYTSGGGSANYSCTYSSTSELPCYEAVTGYDMATGLGTPVFGSLFSYLVPPGVTTSSLGGATYNTPYNKQLSAEGGSFAYTWSVVGGNSSVPAGLSLNSSTGQISGTPTTTGATSFTVHATDNTTGAVASASESIAVSATPSISTTSLPAATVGTSYSTTVASSGGTPALTWSIVGGASSLPPGLTINSATGEITGTPTEVGVAQFAIALTDANGVQAAPETLSITANPVPSITTATLPSGSQGTSYSEQLSSSGGTGPLTWALTPGSSLPAGLTLSSSTGAITGTPLAGGTTTFSIEAIDANGSTSQASFTIMVTVPPSPTTPTSSAPPSTTPPTTITVAQTPVPTLSPPERSSSSRSASKKVSAGASSLAASPSVVVANASTGATVTVTLKTSSGGAVSGKTVSLSATGGSSATRIVSAKTNASGQATFSVSDKKTESVTYRATDTTDKITLSAAVTVHFVAPVAVSTSRSSVTASPVVVTSCRAGAPHATVTVTIRTTGGTPVGGRSVAVSASSGYKGTLSPSGASTRPAGTATFTFADPVAQSVTVSARDATDAVTLGETKVAFPSRHC